MDWVAIGSLAAIAAVIVAVLQLRKQPAPVVTSPNRVEESPSIITYRVDTIEGSIPADLINVLKREERDFAFDEFARRLSRIGGSRVELVNESKGVARDVRMRLNVIGDLYSMRVESTKHLAKEAVRLERDGSSIRICIEELPRDEKVVISFFHEGGYFLGPLKSERGNISLEDADTYALFGSRGR